MTPVFDNNIIQLHLSDARQLPIPDESIDCVVTSPPYFGLRDYGLSAWKGGDDGCNHQVGRFEYASSSKQKRNSGSAGHQAIDGCPKCGAKRVDTQLGLESTPDLYVQNMVEVFREVWRVLKPTGTVWLNLGDSYHNYRADGAYPKQTVSKTKQDLPTFAPHRGHHVEGLKSKDLMGMPWRVAFALQADGWYLRSDIIWSKINPMPESVQDRPTKAHEYIFLLTKSPKYYYDADAIKEEAVAERWGGHKPMNLNNTKDTNGVFRGLTRERDMMPSHRNKRSVWEINTHPSPEAHFATFPEKLVEPCIMAGTSEKGVCTECGKPWDRTFTRTDDRHWSERGDYSSKKLQALKETGFRNDGGGAFEGSAYHPTGWQPTCECNADIVPATVLDPFVGSGTTMAVAQRLGRRGIGTDLNEEYLALAAKRLRSISMPMNMGI